MTPTTTITDDFDAIDALLIEAENPTAAPEAVPQFNPEPAPTVQAVSTAAAEDVLSKALVLSVSIGKLGIRRTLRKDQVDVDADKDLIAASKKLIDSPEYDAISTLDSEIRNWLYSRCLKTKWLKDGMYLAPLAAIEMIDAQVQAFAARRAELVQAFMARYDKAREDAATRLRTVFSERDYPSAAEAARKFYFEWEYITVAPPSEGAVSREIYERESAKIQGRMAQAAEEITYAMRDAMKQLVSNLADRLSGEREGGKPKIFRDSAITNITDFLDTFAARNICNDSELEKLVAQARQVLNGVTPDQLRKQEPLREIVAKQMASINEALGELTKDAPIRAIEFDD